MSFNEDLYYHKLHDQDISKMMSIVLRINHETHEDQMISSFNADGDNWLKPSAIVACSENIWTVILLNKETGNYDDVTRHFT